jgi:hypothetical protein
MPVSYELIAHPNSFHDDHWSIQINEGDYAGVAYQYDTVSIDTQDSGEVVLSFNTITLNNPDDADLKTPEFESIIGEILTEIIENHLKELEANGQDGISDTKASGQ